MLTSQNRQIVFSLLLLLTAAVWGSGFLVMKNVQEIVPMNFILAIRFTVGALGLAFCLRGCKMNFSLIKNGFITGTLIYSAYAVQSYGLNFTTVSKNAVFTALYVVLVPFLAWMVRKEKISLGIYASALASFIGVALISAPGGAGSFNFGDMLSLIGAILYAAHMITVAVCSETSELMPLTCLQFFFAALWAWAGGITFNTFPADLPVMMWGAIAWLAFMATLMAITVMNIGIKYVSSSRTAIILSTESLFACLCGVLFKGDAITVPTTIGISLIFASVVVSQLASSDSQKTETQAEEAAVSIQTQRPQAEKAQSYGTLVLAN